MMKKQYDHDGYLKIVTYEEFDFYYHRDDGPAVIRYHNNGIPKAEVYYYNNIKHRQDGPAVIRYGKNGETFDKEYWIDGKNYTSYYNYYKKYFNNITINEDEKNKLHILRIIGIEIGLTELVDKIDSILIIDTLRGNDD